MTQSPQNALASAVANNSRPRSWNREATLHLDGQFQEADFQRHYSELLAEKEIKQIRLLVDPRPARHEQAQQLIEKGELDRSELRQLVLLIVDRVEAPITQPRIVIRPGSKSPRSQYGPQKAQVIALTLTQYDLTLWRPSYAL